MADNQRIDDLRRRVQKDPASIAFAQLAEEFRRAGQFQEAVDVCRAGLEIHPSYLSARVTLGRAFLELNQLDDAQSELEQVLKSARENLAAIRGLAEIHHRRGELGDALTQYRAALALARNDPELEQTVNELARKIEPAKPAHAAGGLSFEQAQRELSGHAPIAEPETITLQPAPVLSTPVAPAPFTPLAPEPFAPLAPEAFAPLAPAPFTLPAEAPLYVAAEAPAFVAAVAAPPSLPSRIESIEDDSTRARGPHDCGARAVARGHSCRTRPATRLGTAINSFAKRPQRSGSTRWSSRRFPTFCI